MKRLRYLLLMIFLGLNQASLQENQTTTISPSEGSVLFADQFEASSPAWSVLEGSWELCQAAYCAQDKAGNIAAVGEANWRNYFVEAKVKFTSEQAGVAILGRVSEDASRFYQFELKESQGKKVWQLQKNDAGEWSTLRWNAFDFKADTPYYMRLQFMGPYISVYLSEGNDKPTAWQALTTVFDDSFAKGQAGLRTLSDQAQFSQVKVVGPSAWEGPEYYVSPTGSDENSGSLAWPFRTVQWCADLVGPGQSCVLREGVYRETIRPARSGTEEEPIRFSAYKNEKAVISGVDRVTGFSKHNKLFKTTLDWHLGIGKNQLFIDGQMHIEARWPNSGLDVSRPNLASVDKAIQEGNDWFIESEDLPKIPTGSLLNIGLGGFQHPWVMQSMRVIASSKGRLGFVPINADLVYAPKVDNPFFLWGKREFLDSENEWFYDKDSKELFIVKDPEGHVVEVKRRMHAFDLRDRAHIRIGKLHFFASGLRTDSSSKNIVIDSLRAEYVSHYTLAIRPWTEGLKDSGILLHGQGHSIKNSIIRYSAGNGVGLHGHGHVVENNVIQDVSYTANDNAAVNTGCITCPGTSGDHLISHNTLFNSGRSVLVHRETTNTKIVHNHMYNAGLQMSDCGLTYTFKTNGDGTEIAYNLLHDNLAPGLGLGIYLDEGSEYFNVHHNVVWNAEDALRLNVPSRYNTIINNTLIGEEESIDYWGPDEDMEGTRIINNIANRGIRVDFGALKEANISNEAPQVQDASTYNFQLTETSAAIDAGREVSPYTDGFVGFAPDLGAYEFGLEPWTAGSTLADKTKEAATD